jgi:OPC-8:0 CoA ligase-1
MGTSTIPVSKDRKRDLKSSYGSAGWLVNMLEAMVVDVETGRFLPPNCTGELWIRGPSLMQGKGASQLILLLLSA